MRKAISIASPQGCQKVETRSDRDPRPDRGRGPSFRSAGCPACENPCDTHVADGEVGGRAVSVSTLPRPAPASVSQVSKPADLSCVGHSERNLLGEQRSVGPSERERASPSPASQPAGPTKRRAAGIIRARRRLGNLRYNRRLGVSLSLTRIGCLACGIVPGLRGLSCGAFGGVKARVLMRASIRHGYALPTRQSAKQQARQPALPLWGSESDGGAGGPAGDFIRR